MNKGYFVYTYTCRILKPVTKKIFKEERDEKEKIEGKNITYEAVLAKSDAALKSC